MILLMIDSRLLVKSLNSNLNNNNNKSNNDYSKNKKALLEKVLNNKRHLSKCIIHQEEKAASYFESFWIDGIS
jgi:hypothetical protein